MLHGECFVLMQGAYGSEKGGYKSFIKRYKLPEEDVGATQIMEKLLSPLVAFY